MSSRNDRGRQGRWGARPSRPTDQEAGGPNNSDDRGNINRGNNARSSTISWGQQQPTGNAGGYYDALRDGHQQKSHSAQGNARPPQGRGGRGNARRGNGGRGGQGQQAQSTAPNPSGNGNPRGRNSRPQNKCPPNLIDGHQSILLNQDGTLDYTGDFARESEEDKYREEVRWYVIKAAKEKLAQKRDIPITVDEVWMVSYHPSPLDKREMTLAVYLIATVRMRSFFPPSIRSAMEIVRRLRHISRSRVVEWINATPDEQWEYYVDYIVPRGWNNINGRITTESVASFDQLLPQHMLGQLDYDMSEAETATILHNLMKIYCDHMFDVLDVQDLMEEFEKQTLDEQKDTLIKEGGVEDMMGGYSHRLAPLLFDCPPGDFTGAKIEYPPQVLARKQAGRNNRQRNDDHTDASSLGDASESPNPTDSAEKPDESKAEDKKDPREVAGDKILTLLKARMNFAAALSTLGHMMALQTSELERIASSEEALDMELARKREPEKNANDDGEKASSSAKDADVREDAKEGDGLGGTKNSSSGGTTGSAAKEGDGLASPMEEKPDEDAHSQHESAAEEEKESPPTNDAPMEKPNESTDTADGNDKPADDTAPPLPMMKETTNDMFSGINDEAIDLSKYPMLTFREITGLNEEQADELDDDELTPKLTQVMRTHIERYYHPEHLEFLLQKFVDIKLRRQQGIIFRQGAFDKWVKPFNLKTQAEKDIEIASQPFPEALWGEGLHMSDHETEFDVQFTMFQSKNTIREQLCGQFATLADIAEGLQHSMTLAPVRVESVAPYIHKSDEIPDDPYEYVTNLAPPTEVLKRQTFEGRVISSMDVGKMRTTANSHYSQATKTMQSFWRSEKVRYDILGARRIHHMPQFALVGTTALDDKEGIIREISQRVLLGSGVDIPPGHLKLTWREWKSPRRDSSLSTNLLWLEIDVKVKDRYTGLILKLQPRNDNSCEYPLTGDIKFAPIRPFRGFTLEVMENCINLQNEHLALRVYLRVSGLPTQLRLGETVQSPRWPADRTMTARAHIMCDKSLYSKAGVNHQAIIARVNNLPTGSLLIQGHQRHYQELVRFINEDLGKIIALMLPEGSDPVTLNVEPSDDEPPNFEQMSSPIGITQVTLDSDNATPSTVTANKSTAPRQQDSATADEATVATFESRILPQLRMLQQQSEERMETKLHTFGRELLERLGKPQEASTFSPISKSADSSSKKTKVRTPAPTKPRERTSAPGRLAQAASPRVPLADDSLGLDKLPEEIQAQGERQRSALRQSTADFNLEAGATVIDESGATEFDGAEAQLAADLQAMENPDASWDANETNESFATATAEEHIITQETPAKTVRGRSNSPTSSARRRSASTPPVTNTRQVASSRSSSIGKNPGKDSAPIEKNARRDSTPRRKTRAQRAKRNAAAAQGSRRSTSGGSNAGRRSKPNSKSPPPLSSRYSSSDSDSDSSVEVEIIEGDEAPTETSIPVADDGHMKLRRQLAWKALGGSTPLTKEIILLLLHVPKQPCPEWLTTEVAKPIYDVESMTKELWKWIPALPKLTRKTLRARVLTQLKEGEIVSSEINTLLAKITPNKLPLFIRLPYPDKSLTRKQVTRALIKFRDGEGPGVAPPPPSAQK